MALDQLTAFFNQPMTAVAASRNRDLQPYSTRIYGFLPAGDTLEFYIAQQFSAPMVENYRDNGRVTAVADNPFTLEAYQFKGGLLEIRPCGEIEHGRMDAYMAKIKAAFIEFGDAEGLVDNYNAWKCKPGWAVRFAMETVFQQTPGQGTGHPLPS